MYEICISQNLKVVGNCFCRTLRCFTDLLIRCSGLVLFWRLRLEILQAPKNRMDHFSCGLLFRVNLLFIV